MDSPRSNKQLQVGFAGTDMLEKKCPNETNVPSTSIQGLQEAEHAASPEELLISLSAVGMEKDGGLSGQIGIVHIKVGWGQANMVTDPYDIRETPPRETDPIVPMDNEPGNRMKNLSCFPSVNEVDNVEVLPTKGPVT
jgi:hypothetical protein